MEYETENWGLEKGAGGELMTGGCSTLDLCRLYGTPLHVVDERRLQDTARSFIETLAAVYPSGSSVHFAFKCNPVPGIIRIIRSAGMSAEVMSLPELQLALRLGYKGSDIIVNGPFKDEDLLFSCIENGVRFINIDSLHELGQLNKLANEAGKKVDILLRINPDFKPSGMNRGSGAADRRGSPFGLDLKGGEAEKALTLLKSMTGLKFHGFHLHIGSGIRKPADFRKAILKLAEIVRIAGKAGFDIDTIDIGGGLGVPCSREMTTKEMLLYQAFDHLPNKTIYNGNVTFERFANEVRAGMTKLFGKQRLPHLVTEPGRCITGPNQILLLTVHQVKERRGIKKWIITDAGIGTLTLPTFYEHHQIVLCNDVNRKSLEKVTITGPGCFTGDIIYRNRVMPELHPGEIIAVMDSGAYFTSWESTFGYPRPPIVSVMNSRHMILRTRETFEEMFSRDNI